MTLMHVTSKYIKYSDFWMQYLTKRLLVRLLHDHEEDGKFNPQTSRGSLYTSFPVSLKRLTVHAVAIRQETALNPVLHLQPLNGWVARCKDVSSTL